ncbi:MAG TPA: DUF3515 domain-containing protein [Marmoricola sp.]|jgi:hypothetical protein|nr:DUF3515 domain-containing protein [Nocardioidaceae bacterium]HMU36253.1 DUF3515 domain-containing protein [Marmoricola sp.]MCB8993195.1 DUF3515 domain-containing protein [Nocardioidaceae bacterium]MCO5323123.1 DUF3515 domain-containing protein [Nocardioidaceae bacterium]HMY08376.1 DUF3515 domain-containing protein [Marmoricola sp.]
MPRRTYLILPVVALVSACGSVEVKATSPTGEQLRECKAIIKALPKKLGGKSRVSVSGSPYALAWGDPPVVLRCGVGRPSNFDEALGCQSANGMLWFVPSSAIDDQDSDVVMTSMGRSTNVEVTVPGQDRPPVDEMVAVGDVLEQTTTKVGDCA